MIPPNSFADPNDLIDSPFSIQSLSLAIARYLLPFSQQGSILIPHVRYALSEFSRQLPPGCFKAYLLTDYLDPLHTDRVSRGNPIPTRPTLKHLNTDTAGIGSTRSQGRGPIVGRGYLN